MSTVTRRRLLTCLRTVGLVCSPLLIGQYLVAQSAPRPPANVRIISEPPAPSGEPTAPSGGSSSKAVLQQVDITYEGMFYMPTTVNGASTRYGLGLAFRRVNGQKRLFSAINGYRLYEVVVPSTLTPTPLYTAEVARDWGPIVDQSWINGDLRGIYWDPVDSRIYQTMGPYYDPPPPDGRTLFFATLDENTGSMQRFGPWGTKNLPYKMVMGGVTGIPQWFANAYLGGRRLAMGFGGAYSTMGQYGPGSAGPALSAIAPPSPGANAQFSRLDDKPMLSHWWNTREYTQPLRWQRSADVNLKPSYKPSWMWLDGGIWSPKNGVGYWTWVDLFEAAGCWIDTPTKHGVLFAPVLATGDVWYESSDTRYTGLKHIWAMYDPMDLAAVANGSKTPDSVKAVWQADVTYPFNRYPMVNYRGGTTIDAVGGGTPYYEVPKGMAFDPVESMLYILMDHPQYQQLGSVGYDDPVVYVYRVS